MNEKLPQLTLFLVGALGLLASVLVGNAIGSDDLRHLFLIVGAGAVVAWLILAGKYWWLPMAFGVGIGGFFYVPFKLYPHEIALLLSLGSLLPQMILRRGQMKQDREPLPKAFYVLGLYILTHFLVCLVQNDGEGAGNISRAYMNALWPFIFGFYFWRFGATSTLRTGLLLVYFAALLRMGFGLFNYFAGRVYTVPGINYTIDPQDLRASGNIVLVIAVLFAVMKGTLPRRLLHGMIALLSVWAMLLGGSRSGMLTLLFVPLFIFAVSRRWALCTATAGFAAILILWVNTYPKVLENLPMRAARAASIMVIGEKLDVQEDARMSNDWHLVALPQIARERWLHDAASVAFGTGIKPYRPVNFFFGYERNWIFAMAKVSADMGSYESALWTVLAVLGLVGAGLYGWIVLWALRMLIPALLRRRRRDLTWGILLWAALSCSLWVFLIIPSGSYPSVEIFLTILALATLNDEAKKPRPLPIAPPPVVQRSERRLTLARV